MKIKGDFVTNSSSTAFFFIFNGEKKDNLFKLIKKYSSIFQLTDCFDENGDIDCDYKFVINFIDNLCKESDIHTIDELIETFEEDFKYWENAVEEDKKNNSYSERYKDISIEYKNEYEKELIKLKRCKERGLNNYLNIDFGDHNEGQERIMDYRSPNCEKEDFVLISRSQH